ncbi:hypothetical protein [Natrinema sp. SYSU A 869]|uniref:hypothetical protein n=1 Tax=Natrinema sp. SYSU A 869 TaxID=2871694 RepID=UPI001CA3D8FC|nr:hypothetical protein [Natrinema sp. SYSU A 869]
MVTSPLSDPVRTGASLDRLLSLLERRESVSEFLVIPFHFLRPLVQFPFVGVDRIAELDTLKQSESGIVIRAGKVHRRNERPY